VSARLQTFAGKNIISFSLGGKTEEGEPSGFLLRSSSEGQGGQKKIELRVGHRF
jgi:hypothetical protein